MDLTLCSPPYMHIRITWEMLMPQDNPREPLGLLVVKDMVSFIFELQVEFNVRTGLPWKAGPQQPSPNLSKKKMLKIFLLSERHLGTETMNFRDPGGQVAESEPPPPARTLQKALPVNLVLLGATGQMSEARAGAHPPSAPCRKGPPSSVLCIHVSG